MKARKTYKLRGHFAGQSVVLGGFQFTRGAVSLDYSPEDHERIARHLAQWQAEAIDDGKRDSETMRPPQVVGHVQPEGQGSDAGGGTADGVRPTEAAPSDPTVNVGPEGDRQAPSVEERLRASVLALDPDDEGSWTASGRPSLAAIEAAFGLPVTRAKIEAVAPGFKRPVRAGG